MLPKNDRQLESIVNKTLGLFSTKGSGSLHNDGDGKGMVKGTESWIQIMAECKYTDKKKMSTSIKLKEFEKIDRSARRHGRIPIMSTYNPTCNDIFVHIKLSDFKSIYDNHLKYNEGENI